MKIILTTSVFPPDIGGPAHYVPKMAGELSQQGHQVTVVCLSSVWHHDDSSYPFAIVRIRRSLFSPIRLIVATLTIYRLAITTNLIYMNGLPVESALAAHFASVPIVAKVVSDYAWERARNLGWYVGDAEQYQVAAKGLRLRSLDWFRTLPLRHVGRIIVPSGWLQKMVAGWGVSPDRIEVVYNAVESITSASDEQLPPFAGKTIVTVCRLVPWKGVDGLIRQLPKLTEVVRLVIIGDGGLRPDLEHLAADLAVHDRVLFLGNLPQEKVMSYLQQADLFVLNSAYEGLPHVVLEAMMAKVPVVATNAGGTGEVVEDGETGLLVQVGDEQALRQAIVRILNDPNLARLLSHQAEQRLRSKFVYTVMVEKTAAILRSYGRRI